MLVEKKPRSLLCPLPTVNNFPEFRVAIRQIFKAAGVDLCGPVYIKVHPKCKQMSMNYICLRTYAASKMIHFKILPDQFTVAFLKS